jgi:hypothetical protein
MTIIIDENDESAGEKEFIDLEAITDLNKG